MKGKWEGFYQPDTNKHKVKTSLDKIKFILLIDSFHNDHFEGVMNDYIGSKGIIDSWNVSGDVIKNKIFFKKFKGEIKDGPIILYTGEIFEGKNEIVGSWKFKMTIAFIFRVIPIPYRRGRGIWQMLFSKFE